VNGESENARVDLQHLVLLLLACLALLRLLIAADRLLAQLSRRHGRCWSPDAVL